MPRCGDCAAANKFSNGTDFFIDLSVAFLIMVIVSSKNYVSKQKITF